MSRILVLMVMTVLISGCHTLKNISVEKISKAQPASETKTIVSTLSDDKMGGREPGTPGMEAASVWVEDLLKKAGV
ncbi:MAG TPA: hypothetical protein VFU05_03785, partial [Cyclobacteriaceae bacterium]|nr:hypothetical protein [Cyclobacteriaceae bacterium]